MAGRFHIPEEYQGRSQQDWEAEVVAVADSGGWRPGIVHESRLSTHGHLQDRPPGALTAKERRDRYIWKIRPEYIPKPQLPPGSKIICCFLAGQPFISANGYDYFLTDGEHVYKALRVAA